VHKKTVFGVTMSKRINLQQTNENYVKRIEIIHTNRACQGTKSAEKVHFWCDQARRTQGHPLQRRDDPRAGGGCGKVDSKNQKMSAPKFHSPREVAALLGLSTKTVRRAIVSKELPCVIYNRRVWRISAIDAALWYASRGGRVSTKSTSGTTSPDEK